MVASVSTTTLVVVSSDVLGVSVVVNSELVVSVVVSSVVGSRVGLVVTCVVVSGFNVVVCG